jgi:hypothetical protein
MNLIRRCLKVGNYITIDIHTVKKLPRKLRQLHKLSYLQLLINIRIIITIYQVFALILQ